MELFNASIKKDDAGRLTFFEIPFNAKERFCKPKGTIYVSGTINGVQSVPGQIYLQASRRRYGYDNPLLWNVCAYGPK